MIFHKNACKNAQFQKFTGAITCGADQFQCKSGICLYTDNSNCNGPCILSDWTNDGTEDCTDGSDEEDIYYDYLDDYDNDADADFVDVVSRASIDQINSVVMPTSNTLRIKVIMTKKMSEAQELNWHYRSFEHKYLYCISIHSIFL